MIQHGQVFELKTKGVDGQPLWAYIALRARSQTLAALRSRAAA